MSVLGVLLFAVSVILDLVVGEGVDFTPYSVINILIDFIISVCMTHTQSSSLQNAGADGRQIQWECIKV